MPATWTLRDTTEVITESVAGGGATSSRIALVPGETLMISVTRAAGSNSWLSEFLEDDGTVIAQKGRDTQRASLPGTLYHTITGPAGVRIRVRNVQSGGAELVSATVAVSRDNVNL